MSAGALGGSLPGSVESSAEKNSVVLWRFCDCSLACRSSV